MFHGVTRSDQPKWDVFMQVSLKLLGFPESSLKSLKEDVSSPAPPEPKKAKKSDCYSGNEDWQYLISCRANRYLDDDVDESKEKTYIADISLQKSAPLYQHIASIFSIWHHHYEELKLNTFNTKLEDLAKFLHYIASVFSSNSHASVYEKDYPVIKLKMDTVYKLREEFKDVSTSCQALKDTSIYEYVMKIFSGKSTDHYKHQNRHKYSAVVTKIFSLISRYTHKACSGPEDLLSQLKLEGDEPLVDAVIGIMVKEGFTPDDLERLPIGYKMPIKEILHHHKDSDQINMTLQKAKFLRREDIALLKQFEEENEKSKSVHDNLVHESDDVDGMVFNEEIFNIRFNEDLRVNEVKKLLNSSVPITVKVEHKPDMNDHAFAKEEEARLLMLSKRTMALSVARGMLTMGTSQPDLSKAVSIPTLDLSGRSTSSNKTVQIPQTDMNAAQLLWPHFHNGVAAGLKIARGECQIDSTWILLNKLKCSDLNASHSGFLFALGLMGHLSLLPKLHLHDYLTKSHELTTVALLIGTAATKIGTKNTDTYKLLCLHLDSLLPPTALELNVSKTSQTASTISLGLLFFGTCDMYLVKVLLHEIGKPPGPEIENSSDRESHALSAGLALGMIMIGQGTDKTKVMPCDVFTTLYNYTIKGKKKDLLLPNVETSQQQASSQIHEGDIVNTDVTAPAAIMAIALMYLKTNDLRVANSMKVMITETTLDTLKPDHVLYHMLSYNMVMWEALIPSETWISELVPQYNKIVTETSALSLQLVDLKPDLHYHICAIAGSFLALSIKFAGSCNSRAFKLMFPWIEIIRKVADTAFCEEVGARVVLEQCLSTILIGLSVLMAGSGNVKILRIARMLRKRIVDVSYGSQLAIHMAIGFLFLGGGRYTLKTDDVAIASLLCSIYPKWPVNSKDNRFHLQALRHLYVLACEPRLFVARDVDNKKISYTPIQITLKETLYYPETSYKLLSPCFIPELKYIKSISTLGPRYWPVTLLINHKNSRLWLEQIKNVYVKKKAGYLSYSDDPKGHRNLLGRTFMNQSDKLESIKAFSSATNIVLFEEMFGIQDEDDADEKKTSEFFSNILYECVKKEKLDTMTTYLAIEKIVRDVESDEFSVSGFQQLCLLYMYYFHLHPKLVQINSASKEPLISPLYLTQCYLRCDNHIKNIKHSGFDIKRPSNYHAIEELNTSVEIF